MAFSTPAIAVVGTNHEYAPVEVREQLAFGGDRLPAALAMLQDHFPEAFVLSTCNRTEIYAIGDDATATQDAILAFITRYHHVGEGNLRAHSYRHANTAVADHLFRVASGLDSMILGEPQILSQIRDALDAAREAGAIGPALQRLVLDALRIGKRARTVTDIARNRGSIAHAAVDLATKELGPLDGLPVTILGAGKMAGLAARLLRSRGVGTIYIVNRTHDHARRLAESVDGVALPLTDLPDAIARSTIVIAAALADDPIIRTETLPDRTTPLLLIDLGVPRTIEPALATRPMVRLRDIDALAPIQDAFRRSHASEVAKVEALVREATDGYGQWLRSRASVDVIAAIRQHATTVRDSEIEKALRRLGHLSERDQNVVRALAEGLTNKLLHQPIQDIRSAPDDEHRAILLHALGQPHHRT